MKIIRNNGIPTIGGIRCTYASKYLRSEIEELLEKSDIVELPNDYTTELVVSELRGNAVKIKYKEKSTALLRIREEVEIEFLKEHSYEEINDMFIELNFKLKKAESLNARYEAEINKLKRE